MAKQAQAKKVPAAKRSAKAAATPVMPEKAADEPSSAGASRPFPIVAIGASAGGLEALEQFLGQVPADGDMACMMIHSSGVKPPGLSST